MYNIIIPVLNPIEIFLENNIMTHIKIVLLSWVQTFVGSKVIFITTETQCLPCCHTALLMGTCGNF